MRYGWRRLVAAGAMLVLVTTASAEPWLGNRYAQNCGACHSQGRKNVAPPDRRCTLSCQGCHVNPSGGGLRSFYGRWNQERWLRSYRTELDPRTKTAAPVAGQEYGKKPFDQYLKEKRNGDDWIYKKGYDLATLSAMGVNEKNYDRSDRLEYQTSDNWKEFLYQVPDADPYRETERTQVDAGGDVRWLFRSQNSESNSNDAVPESGQKWQNFLMSIDLGVRYRPFYRYLNFVYEGRIFGTPNDDPSLREQLSQMGTRSLYVMVDNLPYNSFVMGGYYRPLIGTSSADHNALGQRMIGSTLIGQQRPQSILFEAISVGAAPNVPFVNLHYISRRRVIGGDFEGDATKGIAVNAGLRFVTLGAAVNATYWRTTDDNQRTGEKTEVEMSSIGVSANFFNRLMSNFEALSMARDSNLSDYRRGGVVTLENKFRVWRENYLFLDYAIARTTADLLPGSATQMKLGVRAFHFSGLETMISYDMDEEKNDGKKDLPENTRKTSYITGQLHAYF